MNGVLDFSNIDINPIKQFSTWFEEAKKTNTINYPDAFCLSTLDPEGFPNGRMLLLKELSEQGFSFYTNSNSQKGRSLANYPKASMTFYWDTLRRQVRIQGDVEKLSEKISDEYFYSRARASQIGAWASNQSEILASRKELEDKVSFFEEKFTKEELTRPSHWNGYILHPKRIEFWQERPARLHDRLVFHKLLDNQWNLQRLSP
ncbi:MAG: pyridoxamine 5'-phosphate oxidase [Proteobacteria bacterium]|nr:pyridoxamine 5'-phosphate oxidase [Pseudomonadota bacterium]